MTPKKYTKILVIIICIILSAITITATNIPIKITLNGKEISSDIQPQNIKGRIMVPVRVIAEAFNSDVKWDSERKTVVITKDDNLSINNTKLIATLTDEKINIYGKDVKDGVYNSVILEINGFKKNFNWQSISNPSFSPQLMLEDINNDGDKELIVNLTTAEGTGLYIHDVHVFNLKSLNEIPVQDPLEIIKDAVKVNITPNDIVVTVDGQQKTIKKADIDSDSSNFFDTLSFSNQINFKVINNELTAIVGVQISPTTFIGDLYITYQFKDNSLIYKTIKFKQDT